MKILNIKYVPASTTGRADNFYSVAGGGMKKGKIIEGSDPFWIVEVEMTCPDCGIIFIKKIDTNEDPTKHWSKPDEYCAPCDKKRRKANLEALDKAEAEAESNNNASAEEIDKGLREIFGDI